MQIVLTILSVIFVLFLPGFLLSFVFLKNKQTDSIERLALSFGLSIVVVPLVVFYTNLLGIPITTTNLVIEVCAILLCVAIILLIQFIQYKRRPRETF